MTDAAEPLVEVRPEGAVCVIALRRERKLNALSAFTQKRPPRFGGP